MAITKNDIPDYAPATIELPNGWTAEIKVEYDDTDDAPWERADGHGPVSDWRPYRLNDGSGDYARKKPGERLLCRDGSAARYYDFAEAMRIARRDAWGCGDDTHKHPTKRAQAACAVERDFDWLRRWCMNEWHYVGVIVQIRDAQSEMVSRESVWGIEDDTDYWRDVAADIVNGVCAGLVLPTYAAEREESASCGTK